MSFNNPATSLPKVSIQYAIMKFFLLTKYFLLTISLPECYLYTKSLFRLFFSEIIMVLYDILVLLKIYFIFLKNCRFIIHFIMKTDVMNDSYLLNYFLQKFLSQFLFQPW